MPGYEEHKKFANNAAKLADYLETVPDENHDQETWTTGPVEGLKQHACGTSACALGWAVVSGEFEELSYRPAGHNETNIPDFISPKVVGMDASWWMAGHKVFGDIILSEVFEDLHASKQETIDRLRECARYHCDIAKLLAPKKVNP